MRPMSAMLFHCFQDHIEREVLVADVAWASLNVHGGLTVGMSASRGSESEDPVLVSNSGRFM